MKSFKGMKLLTGLLSVMLIMGFGTLNALAGVPKTVSYQGELANSAADNVTMTFSLFDNEEGSGDALWSEEDKAITVVNGVVSTILGDEVEITEDVLSNATHLGVQINGGELMKPLSELTSSIFAMRALVADRLAADAQVVTLNYAQPGSVKAGDLAENAVETSNIQEGAVSSLKTVESLVNIAPTVPGEAETFELTKVHQGLVLVSGNTTIKLPLPENAEGQRFTIKKTDDGLQRRGQSVGHDACDIMSNQVTIQVGDNSSNVWFTPEGKFSVDDKKIENRTNFIKLKYKNSFATFISNGELWYITDSNPPVDIINPVPGGFGEVNGPDNLATGQAITMTITNASDCNACNYDECGGTLYYMPVFSKNVEHKLKTMDEVFEQGYKCASTWVEVTPSETEPLVFTCDPTNNYQYSTTLGVKMNIVVRDEAGNMSVYNPPGDNDPPYVSSGSVIYKGSGVDTNLNEAFISLNWEKADDGVTPQEEIVYKVEIAQGSTVETIKDFTVVNLTYSEQDNRLLGTEGVRIRYKIYDNDVNSFTLTVGDKYDFYIYAKDKMGNVFPYDKVSETITDTE